MSTTQSNLTEDDKKKLQFYNSEVARINTEIAQETSKEERDRMRSERDRMDVLAKQIFAKGVSSGPSGGFGVQTAKMIFNPDE